MNDAVAPPSSVEVERSFEASPAHVYAAWLDPAMAKVWMSPGSISAARAEIDPQVGGHYRIWHVEDGVVVGGFDGEFLELVPNRRLVFAWGLLGPERENGPVFDSRLTVTFAENDAGGTDLTLLHEHLEEFAAAKPDVAAMIETGWRTVLDKLATLVE